MLSEEYDLNWTATQTPFFIYGICVLTTAWWFKFKVKPPIDHADYCHTTRYTGIGSRLAKFEGYSLCDLSYNVNHECTEVCWYSPHIDNFTICKQDIAKKNLHKIDNRDESISCVGVYEGLSECWMFTLDF